MDPLRSSSKQRVDANDWLSGLGDALGALPTVTRSQGGDFFETVAPLPVLMPPERHADIPPSNDGNGIVLAPIQLESYCNVASRMVQSAQLGHEFVDANWVISQLQGLRHIDSIGTPLEMAISDVTGLPMRSAWNAVQGASRAARESPEFRRLSGKTVWRQLRELEGRRLDKINIDVVDLDIPSGNRQFRIYVDCYVAPGYLMRTTAVIEQPKHIAPNFWGRAPKLPVNLINGRDWVPEPTFQSNLECASAAPLSYFATAAMAEFGNCCVEFTRGVIGPIYFDGVGQPSDVAEVLAHYPGEAIGCFRSYRISRKPADGDTSAISDWRDAEDPLLENVNKVGFTTTIRELWVATRAVKDELELRARLGERPLTIREMY